jgi:hypothetical protein
LTFTTFFNDGLGGSDKAFLFLTRLAEMVYDGCVISALWETGLWYGYFHFWTSQKRFYASFKDRAGSSYVFLTIILTALAIINESCLIIVSTTCAMKRKKRG